MKTEVIKTIVCHNCGLIKEDQIVHTEFNEVDLATGQEIVVEVAFCLKCKKEITKP